MTWDVIGDRLDKTRQGKARQDSWVRHQHLIVLFAHSYDETSHIELHLLPYYNVATLVLFTKYNN